MNTTFKALTGLLLLSFAWSGPDHVNAQDMVQANDLTGEQLAQMLLDPGERPSLVSESSVRGRARSVARTPGHPQAAGLRAVLATRLPGMGDEQFFSHISTYLLLAEANEQWRPETTRQITGWLQESEERRLGLLSQIAVRGWPELKEAAVPIASERMRAAESFHEERSAMIHLLRLGESGHAEMARLITEDLVTERAASWYDFCCSENRERESR